ncbi:hypothetical protein ARMGADRAFT_1030003 [Armillaria gallica]|uniref:Uncharacterized protein n=1 Tax=Armillaria gallica TaxID=47427 RepID=A0A2H3DDM3_ARMGA|nr:hypothetical protein ARMGADRAFT_1030003 [Armillaria gallica]
MPKENRGLESKVENDKQSTQGTNCRDDSTYSPKAERPINAMCHVLPFGGCSHFHDTHCNKTRFFNSLSCSLGPLTIPDFSLQNLKLHPELLVHKEDTNAKATAFDRVLGGLYDKFIVTTPNASALWAPPLGSN